MQQASAVITPFPRVATPPGRRRCRPDPELRLVESSGPWGGPVYEYRGAQIWANAAATEWQLWIDDHPLRGLSLRRLSRAIELADAWIDRRALPGR